MNNDITQIPLAEYDPDKKAIIEPSLVVEGKSPSEYCVMPFFGAAVRKLRDEGKLEKIQEARNLYQKLANTAADPELIEQAKQKLKELQWC